MTINTDQSNKRMSSFVIQFPLSFTPTNKLGVLKGKPTTKSISTNIYDNINFLFMGWITRFERS